MPPRITQATRTRDGYLPLHAALWLRAPPLVVLRCGGRRVLFGGRFD
jgi:hypothetical protein